MSVERTGEGSVIHLPARYFPTGLQSILTSIRNEINGGPVRVIVDFKETALIDSSAIGGLVSIAKDARARGVPLVIRNLSGDIAELFLDSGLDKIFNIETEGKVQRAEIDIFEKAVDIRLDIKPEIVDAVCIFHLVGVMNHPQGSRFFKQEFLLAMAQYKKILLDLEELTFFDSLSVSVVLSMNKLIRETGGSVRLCGANYIVNDLFSTLNIGQIIPVYNVVIDALADWT